MWNTLTLLFALTCLLVGVSAQQLKPDFEFCFGEYVNFQIETRFETCKDNLRYSIDPEGDGLPDSLMLDPVTGRVEGVFRPDWTGYGDIGKNNRQLQTGQTYYVKVLVTNALDGSLVDEVNLGIYRSACDPEPLISNFMIVDTKRNVDVRPLVDDDIVSLGWLKDRFSIRATVFPEVETETFFPEHIIDKVRFVLDGKGIRTENFAPYSLGGDTTDGDHNWGNFNAFDISEGKHTLTAIPFGVDGKAGTSMTKKFTITECRGHFCE